MHMPFRPDSAILTGFSGSFCLISIISTHRASWWRRRYMPDATRSQHPKPRNAVRTCCFMREACCLKKTLGYCWPTYVKVLEVLFSCASFPSFFAFKEGMWDIQISALGDSPTVSPGFVRLITSRCVTMDKLHNGGCQDVSCACNCIVFRN